MDDESKENVSAQSNKQNFDERALSAQEFQAVLHERMQKLATVKQVDDEKDQQYLRIQLGDEEQYGIPYHYLKEILSAEQFVGVPGITDHIVGVVNWRSKILSVLDLRKVFDIDHKITDTLAWVVVIASGNITMGIVADNIIGDESFLLDKLAEPLPSGKAMNTQYVLGIDKGAITVLNIEAVLAQYEANMQVGDADQLGEFNG